MVKEVIDFLSNPELVGIIGNILQYINESILSLPKEEKSDDENKYIIDISSSVPIPTGEKEKIVEKIKDEDIMSFYKVLKDNIDEENLNYFYNNLKTLKILKYNIKDRKNDSLAYYEPYYNTIKYSKNMRDGVLPHELFHMASSCVRKCDNSRYSGFYQDSNINNFKSIGNGINEGYTQLLATRYFENAFNNSYVLEKFFARKLEELVGKKEMEKLYFNADLDGLVKVLKKYIKEEDILIFLKSLDNIDRYYNENITTNDMQFFKLFFEEALFLLSNMKCKQLKEQNLDVNEIQNQLMDYSKDFYNVLLPFYNLFYENEKVGEKLTMDNFDDILCEILIENFNYEELTNKSIGQKHI